MAGGWPTRHSRHQAGQTGLCIPGHNPTMECRYRGLSGGSTPAGNGTRSTFNTIETKL